MKRLFAAAVATAAVATGAVALAPAARAATPHGTYRATIHTQSLGGVVNGVWTITLTRGHYAVGHGGKTVLKGKDSVHGSTITVGGGGPGTYCRASGKYGFHLHHGTLTFTEISDSSSGCGGRRVVLTDGRWAKV